MPAASPLLAGASSALDFGAGLAYLAAGDYGSAALSGMAAAGGFLMATPRFQPLARGGRFSRYGSTRFLDNSTDRILYLMHGIGGFTMFVTGTTTDRQSEE